MATKTIIANCTLHRPDTGFVPFEFNPAGGHTKGSYKIVETPPGTPVEVDADEADSLITRGLAEEALKGVKRLAA